ncbi:MAG: hypothetical protein ACREGR_03940 [Minisyncoccia bacterium]
MSNQNYAIDPLDMDELLMEDKRLATQGGSDFMENLVRMPEGNGFVTVRLLPPAKGRKFFCATRTHRVNGKSIHCTRVLNGGKWVDPEPQRPCVICKYYGDLWKQSEKEEGAVQAATQNAARDIKPVERYYYNCVVRHQINPKTQEVEKNIGPKILSIGKTLHQRIVRAIVGDPANEEKPLGDVTHPVTGRDFKIVKRMKGQGKDAYPYYDDSKFQDPSPLGEPDQVSKWMEALHDLNALRKLIPREEMALELKKHLGIIKDEQVGYDPSEFQRPAGQAPAATVEARVAAATQAAPARPPIPTQVEVKKPEGATVPSGKSLTDPEFMNELNSLKEGIDE